MIGRPASVVCLGLAWAAISVPAHAQDSTARISGTVVDSVGLVLAGAGLTLAATAGVPVAGATPVARIVATTTTTASGQFVFEALSAGTYVIIAELGGFARGVHPPISVIDGQSVEIRLALAPAALAEVVTVVGSTGAGDPIEEDQFQALFLRVFQLPTDRFQEVTCPP